jgi:hypothetical protein
VGLLDKVIGKAAGAIGNRAGASGDDPSPGAGDAPPVDPAHLPGAGAAIALTDDTPHDESDPGFAPIEGIGLERYADLAVGMQGMDEEGMRAYAEANGVKPGTWDKVREGWNARFNSMPAVTLRWGQLYRQALARGGIERPDISFEQYARITAQRNKGVALDDVYAEYGLDVSGWALVSDHWVGQLAADPQLAVKFEDLVKAEEAKLA